MQVPSGKYSPIENDDHRHHGHSHDNCVWGWDDKDMPEEDKKDVQIYNKRDWIPKNNSWPEKEMNSIYKIIERVILFIMKDLVILELD